MLIFDSVWIHKENTDMKQDGKLFIVRFLILVFFDLMIPIGYLACLLTTEEEI